MVLKTACRGDINLVEWFLGWWLEIALMDDEMKETSLYGAGYK